MSEIKGIKYCAALESDRVVAPEEISREPKFVQINYFNKTKNSEGIEK